MRSSISFKARGVIGHTSELHISKSYLLVSEGRTELHASAVRLGNLIEDCGSSEIDASFPV
jgi:hypothetical protein